MPLADASPVSDCGHGKFDLTVVSIAAVAGIRDTTAKVLWHLTVLKEMKVLDLLRPVRDVCVRGK